MIRYIPEGDLFNSAADGLVNPVNTKGVMGKGIALEFSQRFPEIMQPYKGACLTGKLRPGVLMLVRLDVRIASGLACSLPSGPPREKQWAISEPSGALHLPLDHGVETRASPVKKERPAVILFPTKDHWRFKSRIEWIDQGLETLKGCYQEWGLNSIAMPQLGCGLGGLHWEQVKPLIERHFATDPVEIEVYLSAVDAFNEKRESASTRYPEAFFKSADKKPVQVRDNGAS